MNLEDFRYEHRGLYRTLLGIIIFVVAMSIFMLLPKTPLMRTIGVSTVQAKLVAFKNAIYWQTRAYIHTEDSLKPVVVYGSMLGVTKKGGLLINVANGSRYEQRIVYFADIRLTDLHGVARSVQARRTEDAKFEVYGENAVIWVKGVPLNLTLIEDGYAIPEPNPPTNIVDIVFAAYYWRQLREGS